MVYPLESIQRNLNSLIKKELIDGHIFGENLLLYKKLCDIVNVIQ